jgi:hypothetical protein
MTDALYRLVVLALLFAFLPSATSAQCAVASDPEYGYVPGKAVPIGGGPVEGPPRVARYLNALRAPGGGMLTWQRVDAAPLQTADGRTLVIDARTSSLNGSPITVYLNLSDFDLPQAPSGLTCVQQLSLAVGPPSGDPFAAMLRVWEILPPQWKAREFAPIPLRADGTDGDGIALDYVRMLMLRTRTANGVPLPQPPSPAAGGPLAVAAYPRTCNGTVVVPMSIDVVTARGANLQRAPGYATGTQLARVLPGVPVPPGTIAALFALGLPHLATGDRIRITYSASDCPDASRELVLPVTYTAPRPRAFPQPPLPPGTTEPDPTVFVQAIVDTTGRFDGLTAIAGPASLRAAAVDAVRQWTVEPALMNGAPVVTYTTLRVTFAPR